MKVFKGSTFTVSVCTYINKFKSTTCFEKYVMSVNKDKIYSSTYVSELKRMNYNIDSQSQIKSLFWSDFANFSNCPCVYISDKEKK